jgi:hypothetical protein
MGWILKPFCKEASTHRQQNQQHHGGGIMSETFSGSCACGKVSFALTPQKYSVLNCHCHTCRKLNGGAFSTYVAVADEAFEIERGRAELARYAVTENVDKFFCRICGTPMYNKNKKYPGLTIVPLGALDHPEGLKPAANIFCESKLSWVPLQDDATNHPQGLPS